MPLIRYRTGDFVRLAEAPSAHPSPRSAGQSVGGGRESSEIPVPLEGQGLEYPWPAAVEVAGREQEFLISTTGRRISLTAFNMHDTVFDDLYAVQFYQDQPGVAEFRYVAGPKFCESRLDPIRKRVHAKLGDDFEISFREVKEVEKTPRGKHRWLVSKLPQANFKPGQNG